MKMSIKNLTQEKLTIKKSKGPKNLDNFTSDPGKGKREGLQKKR